MTLNPAPRDDDSPPTHLAAFWPSRDSVAVLEAVLQYRKANPVATDAELEAHRYRVQLAIADGKARKAEKGAERLASLRAATTCPCCGAVDSVRAKLVHVPGGPREERDVARPEYSIGGFQAMRDAKRLNPDPVDDDRPLPPRFLPEPGERVTTPFHSPAPFYACARCRPVVEAALVQVLRGDDVDGTKRGELADAYARRIAEGPPGAP